MFSGSGLSPGPFAVFCPVGKTPQLGKNPVVERLTFVQLGPGVIAPQPT